MSDIDQNTDRNWNDDFLKKSSEKGFTFFYELNGKTKSKKNYLSKTVKE